MTKRGIRRVGQVAPVRSGNASIDRFQDDVAAKLNPLLRGAFAQAIPLEATLVSGLNKIGHGLGVPVPHFICAALPDPGAAVTSAQPENPRPESQIWLRMSGPDYCQALLFLLPVVG